MLSVKRIGLGFIALAVITSQSFVPVANGQSFDSVSHIHQVKVVANKVLVLTHEGLYKLVSKNNMKLVGKEKIDVMGFTTLGKVLFASGHPAK